MNTQPPHLQILTYGIDGTTRMFTQDDSDMANSMLLKLNPMNLFVENTVKIPDGDAETTFASPELARIDLITDQLSVWDFPFVLGAHVELTEAEYRECLDNPHQWASPGCGTDQPVFLGIAMMNGHCYFFWMEVAGGLSAISVSRIHSMLKEGRFIFGLRTGGVGILNLANMTQFSVYPKPADAADEAHYEVHPRKKFRILNQSEDGRPHLVGVAEDPDF